MRPREASPNLKKSAASILRGDREEDGAARLGSPQLEALSQTSLARGSSTKEATVLALSLRASPIRPWGVSGRLKPLIFFSGKILMEYSPVV